MARYLIVSEADDRLVHETHGTDEQAEDALGDFSVGRVGSFLLFHDGRLMAHARDGAVFSFRPESNHDTAPAVAEVSA